MSWTMIEDNRAMDAVLHPDCLFLAVPIVIWSRVFATGRALFALVAAALGVLYFAHPGFSPGAPQMVTAFNIPLPAQPAWSYWTGIAFLAAAAAIFLNSKIRLAATMLGILILLFGLIVWVPWLATHPEDAACGHYLKDMGLAGGALLLAGALPLHDG
jgi:uncharacterized membrane protein YphA (DoxX/SURF4 family)